MSMFSKAAHHMRGPGDKEAKTKRREKATNGRELPIYVFAPFRG